MIECKLSSYKIIGLLTEAIDYVIYCGLIYIDLLDLVGASVASRSGFIGGSIFSYFANQIWTANSRVSSEYRLCEFIFIDSLGFSANIKVNLFSINRLIA